jgi:hypothetical protein
VPAFALDSRLAEIYLSAADAFLARFQLAASAEPHLLPEGSVNTIMPWIPEAGMSEKDLGAIYAYLRTVKPVKNQVEVFPEAR